MAAIALLLVATALVVRWLDPEPRHRGRPLSAWLDDPTLTEAEIRQAVRAIGTNAIPSLQRWLVEQPTWLERSLRWVDLKQPYFIFNHAPSAAANQRAVRGFLFLGELAAPVVPWLVAGAQQKDADFQFYIMTLATCGPAGAEALDRMEADASDLHERWMLVNALAYGRPRSPGAVARLLRRVSDPEQPVRDLAIWALGEWQENYPPEVLAAMRDRARNDPDEKIRRRAELAIKEFTRFQSARDRSLPGTTNAHRVR